MFQSKKFSSANSMLTFFFFFFLSRTWMTTRRKKKMILSDCDRIGRKTDTGEMLDCERGSIDDDLEKQDCPHP